MILYECDFTKNDIGELIKDYRENFLKISTGKLAELLNYDENVIIQVESGISPISYHVFRKFLNFYRLKCVLTIKT